MWRLNGSEVRRLRMEVLAMTQEELAARVGVAPNQISAIEVGYRTLRGERVETRVKVELLRDLAEALGVTPANLIVPEATGLPTRPDQAAADRLPASEAVNRYLEAVASAYRSQKWTEQAAELFVQSESGIPEPGGPRLRSWAATRSPRVCFLVGDFGSGKSGLARGLSAELADDLLSGQAEALFPVFVELREARHLIPRTEQEFLSITLPHVPAQALSTVPAGKLLVILDGLDELLDPSDPSPPPYLDLVNAICRLTHPETRFLVTCREWTFSPISVGLQRAFRRYVETKADEAINRAMRIKTADSMVLRVCELTDKEGDNYLNGTSAASVWAKVGSQESYRQFARRPFTLRLLERALPEMRVLTEGLDLATLFEIACEARLLNDLVTERDDDKTVGGLMDQLEDAVFAELTDPCKQFDDRRAFVHEGTLGAAITSTFKPIDRDRLLSVGLLRDAGEGKLRFMHHSLVEFFIARRMSKELMGYKATTLTKLNLVDAYNINRIAIPMVWRFCDKSTVPGRLHPVTRGEYMAFLLSSEWREGLKYGLRPTNHVALDGTPHHSTTLPGDGGPIEVRKDPTEGPAHEPVICVSWYDALQFCRWRGGRLPTKDDFRGKRASAWKGAEHVWTGDWFHEPHSQMTVVQPHSPNVMSGVNPDLRNDRLGICVVLPGTTRGTR